MGRVPVVLLCRLGGVVQRLRVRTGRRLFVLWDSIGLRRLLLFRRISHELSRRC